MELVSKSRYEISFNDMSKNQLYSPIYKVKYIIITGILDSEKYLLLRGDTRRLLVNLQTSFWKEAAGKYLYYEIFSIHRN